MSFVSRLFGTALALTVLTTPLTAQTVSDADLAVTSSQFKATVSGKTVRTYSQRNGNRIEYFATNGKVYVWPARMQLLIGTWKPCTQDMQVMDTATGTTKPVKIASICRTLPNPNGGTQTWNSTWPVYGKQIVERADGDLFGLSQRADAPYAMGKRSLPFAKVQANIKKYTK